MDLALFTAAYHRVRLKLEAGLTKKFYGSLYREHTLSCFFLSKQKPEKRQNGGSQDGWTFAFGDNDGNECVITTH